MFNPGINDPGPWQWFVQRTDNVGIPLMEQRRKYMREQLLFEGYMSTINTVNTVSTVAAGAAGGPAPNLEDLDILKLYFGSDVSDQFPAPITLNKEPYNYNGSSVWYGEGQGGGELNWFFLFFSVEATVDNFPVNKWQVIFNDATFPERSPAGITASLDDGQFIDDPEGGEPALLPNNPKNPIGVYQNFEEAAWAVTLPGVSRADSGAT